MNQPLWLTEQMVLAIHEELIFQYGGLSGVRDSGLLLASLARPRHRFSYQSEVSCLELAAAYGFALCKNHPFVDGNKRTAFMVMYVFLRLNGYDFTAPESEISCCAFKLGMDKGLKPLVSRIFSNEEIGRAHV